MVGKGVEIVAINESGDREEITDLYWFEENLVQAFDGTGPHDHGYTFEIYINGNHVYSTGDEVK